ncbi:hypothetical protein H2200_005560 [Cladophialophora chaetospira]|uniref:non-specific serine/threonine protein kinase n=1 Tax=Cladophialophora chaetospira TaxID=386627 RepID=A0AA39CK08_9EURO|nr:hypothetical protein H2200_005560 [Cladophialophora chaetospira]
MRKRFKEINITIELLSGQLVTVKAALSQINLLISESLSQNEQHFQLTMDLGVATGCCNLLLRLLDEQIAKLQYSDMDEVTFVSKVNMMLESKGTEECLIRLDRQINALNLLITAFKCRNPEAQQNILEEKKSRRLIDQVKDDSSSLIVLCDSASFVTKRTQTTTATSKFSVNFSFDAEILQAKAYMTTLRSLMRRAQKDSPPAYNDRNFHRVSRAPLSKVRRPVSISTPENAMHMIHVGYDERNGKFTGLPSEWAKLLNGDNVLGFHERQEIEQFVARTSFTSDYKDDEVLDGTSPDIVAEGNEEMSPGSSCQPIGPEEVASEVNDKEAHRPAAPDR